MTGVGRYISGLIGGLARIDQKNRYVLFSSSLKDRPSLSPLPHNFQLVDRRIPVSLLNAAWHRLGHPSLDLLTGCKIDLTHSPHPLVLPSRRGRAVVTVHDIFFYRHAEATTAEIRRDYAPLLKTHVDRADAVLTVSEATATDLMQELGVERHRITVVPNGVDTESFRGPSPDEEEIAGRYRLPKEYILSVATLEPRKNVPRLVEAVARLVQRGWDGSLVLAGGSAMDEPRVDADIERLGVGSRVIKLGYVPPGHLPALYRRARLLVTVSLWEGFGLTLLEAMACDLPVVASDIPAHREVAKDGAWFVDPSDSESIASGIERLWDDPALQSRLREEGARRVKLFTWEEAARKTLAIYQQLGQAG
jgi:glycosyltransferase involved in cell wall biosynthesis